MSASDEKKTPVDQALDLLVYAPLGLLFNVQEVLPKLVELGKQQVNMARVFGQFAVEQEGPKQLSQLQAKATEVATDLARRRRTRPAPSRMKAAAPAAAGEQARTVEAEGPANPSNGAPTSSPAAASLAIPDYDSLSASQVVPRLEALSADELEAVREYEAAHRGRKTILSKVSQLQSQ